MDTYGIFREVILGLSKGLPKDYLGRHFRICLGYGISKDYLKIYII
jgi:hypothetical protein